MRDFSHEFTAPLKGTQLNSWAIFYAEFGKREFSTFIQELQNTVKNDFKISCKKPKTIKIEGKDNDSRNWIDAIQQTNTEDKLDFIIILAPGRKGSSPIYDDVKVFCHNNINVPT